MNLIIDENLPPRWCEFLASHGLSAIHWTNIGKPGDPDDLVFNHAVESHSIIITQDSDFTRMLASRGSRLPSVIQLRLPCPTPELSGPILIRILQDHRQRLLDGCLVSVEPDRHRIRVLPLR